jgi:prepilin peptidase CpaA
MDIGFWQVTCAVLVPGVLLASWIDYAQRRVPNWLNLALIIVGFGVQGMFFAGDGLLTGFLGMLTGFGLLIIPWLMHAMGAGDVKLMAAIGVWLGPALTFQSFLLGVVLGGVAGVIMIVVGGRVHLAAANMQIIFAKCMSSKTLFSEFGSVQSFGTTTQKLPYGVPLTAGTLIMMGFHLFG